MSFDSQTVNLFIHKWFKTSFDGFTLSEGINILLQLEYQIINRLAEQDQTLSELSQSQTLYSMINTLNKCIQVY